MDSNPCNECRGMELAPLQDITGRQSSWLPPAITHQNIPAAGLQMIPFQQCSDQGNNSSLWPHFKGKLWILWFVNSRTCNLSPQGCKWLHSHPLRTSCYPSHTGTSLPKPPSSLCCLVRLWPGTNFQPVHALIPPLTTHSWRSGSSIPAQDPNMKVTWFPGVLSITNPHWNQG